MKWTKKGLLFKPDTSKWWSRKYALYPTPYLVKNDDIIRIFFGSVDENFFGRVSYIDVDANDPSSIKSVAADYILDIGLKGTFDDCGVTPACAIDIDDKLHLYYNGFSRSFQIPYYIFSGVAIEKEGVFEKYSKVPVLDRSNEEYFDKAGQSIVWDNGMFKTWYVSGLSWETITSSIYTNKLLPIHVIRYGESPDGIHWRTRPEICIDFKGEDEFGFGRPWVILENGIYKMWYSIRRKNLPYRIGYAESDNGITWKRMDEKMQLEPSEEGWDSQMICFASVIKAKDKTFMFYNGNNYGETGFGYAIFENE
jgi:predicted GH43/DUF377 family glycosyl hydrolase